VAESQPVDPEDEYPRSKPVEAFIAEQVRSHPGSAFGALIHAIRAEFGVSRSTAARYLSDAVRYGEVARLPDQTYVASGLETYSTRPVVEVRRHHEIFLVEPKGSVTAFLEEEFRVVSGRLDHIEVRLPRAPRTPDWWLSWPSRASGVAPDNTPESVYTVRHDFFRPLTPRRTEWQQLYASFGAPHSYRMVRSARTQSSTSDPRRDPDYASESIEVRSELPRFRRRLAPDAHMRLQVILPEGYPHGAIRCRVFLQTESNRRDPVEEERIDRLSADPASRDGVRQAGSKLLLTVPRPKIERVYWLEWELPTHAQRNRWLEHQSARLQRMIEPDRRGVRSRTRRGVGRRTR
jgi:hypothetical protein